MKSGGSVIGLLRGMFEKICSHSVPAGVAILRRSTTTSMCANSNDVSKSRSWNWPARRMIIRPNQPVSSQSTPTGNRYSSISACDSERTRFDLTSVHHHDLHHPPSSAANAATTLICEAESFATCFVTLWWDTPYSLARQTLRYPCSQVVDNPSPATLICISSLPYGLLNWSLKRDKEQR